MSAAIDLGSFVTAAWKFHGQLTMCIENSGPSRAFSLRIGPYSITGRYVFDRNKATARDWWLAIFVNRRHLAWSLL